MRLFVGLVEIFTVVSDLANGRIGCRRDFHQVQAPLPGKLNRLKRRHHPQLPTIFVHDSDFARPDAVIYTDPVSLPKTPFSDKSTPQASRPPDGGTDTQPQSARPKSPRGWVVEYSMGSL